MPHMHLTGLKIWIGCSLTGIRLRGQKWIVHKVCLGTCQSFCPSSLVNDTRLEYWLLILKHSFMCCGFLLTSLSRVSAKKEQRRSEICLEWEMELLNLPKDTSLFIDNFFSLGWLKGTAFWPQGKEKLLFIKLNHSYLCSYKAQSD